MKDRGNRARLERVLDLADGRMERQTFLPHADRCVELVDAYHYRAGELERKVLRIADACDPSYLAGWARTLLAILRQHAAGSASRYAITAAGEEAAGLNLAEEQEEQACNPGDDSFGEVDL